MTRAVLILAAAAALCIGACAPRVDTTATVAPHLELTVGRASEPVARPAPVVVKREVQVVPQIPQVWRHFEPAPALPADDATQDELAIWALQERHAGADCRSRLGTVDELLTKAERGAR